MINQYKTFKSALMTLLSIVILFASSQSFATKKDGETFDDYVELLPKAIRLLNNKDEEMRNNSKAFIQKLSIISVGSKKYSKDPKKFVELIKLSAESNVSCAQYAYSEYFKGLIIDGVDIVKKSNSDRIKWLQLAVEGGCKQAQLTLAGELKEGDLLTANFKKSFELYRQLAISGDPFASIQVGIAYAIGEGVERDQVKALAWIYYTLPMVSINSISESEKEAATTLIKLRKHSESKLTAAQISKATKIAEELKSESSKKLTKEL